MKFLNLHLLDDWTFVSGQGYEPAKRACVMSAYSMLTGQEFSDSPLDVDRHIRSFCMGVNDALSTEELRQQFAYGIIGYIGETSVVLGGFESLKLLGSLIEKYSNNCENKDSGHWGLDVSDVINAMSDAREGVQILVQELRKICEKLHEIKKGVKNEECTLT